MALYLIPDARDEISVTVIATGLTRNSADSAEPVKRPNAHVQVAQHGHATQAVVEDDDVPAIQRQNQDAAPAASSASTVSAARPTPMSISRLLEKSTT